MHALDSVLSTAEMKALILRLGVSSAVGCVMKVSELAS